MKKSMLVLETALALLIAPIGLVLWIWVMNKIMELFGG